MTNFYPIKFVLLCIVLILFKTDTSLASNKENASSESWYNPKDSIQSIVIKGEDFDEEGNSSFWSERYVYQYGENDNEIEYKYYYPEKTLLRVLTNEYDQKGNLAKTKVYEVGGDTTFYDYKYDEKGNEIEEVSYENDTLSYRISNEFNSHGHKIKSTWYDDMGLIGTETFAHKYSDNGEIIEKKSFNFNGELNDRRVYSYENGMLLNELRYNGNSILIYKQIEKYDSKGHNIESTFYDYVEGELVRKIKAVSINDEKGNWIEMKQYVNDKLKSIKKREINYFN